MINPIENEELAVSVRAKLNQAIALINQNFDGSTKGDYYSAFTAYHYDLPHSYGTTFIGNFPPIVRPSILVREISFQYQGDPLTGVCDAENKFDFVLSTKSGDFTIFTVDSAEKITSNEETIFPINEIVSGLGNPYFLIFSSNIIGSPSLSGGGANLNFGLRWSLLL